MKIEMFSNLKGDTFGGLSSSIIALPLALAFGVVAFAPLGPDFASQGALACLYGAIFTGFFASLFGGTPTQITGPTGPMSVMIASMITANVAARNLSPIQAGPELDAILAMVFLAVVLGGLFQVFLGLCGGGRLIKYIPYPVIAGFMNGVATIIFLSQVKPFLGLSGEESVFDIFSGAASPSLISIAVGAITIAAVVLGPRWLKGVPGALLGLAVGILSYFAIALLGRSELLSVVDNPYIIGNIPTALPKPEMAGRIFAEIGGMDSSLWLAILMPALTLGMLGSIDSLLTSLVADVVTKTRHNSRQELFGQGVGNILAALFGGLPGAGSTVRTLANVQNGGRTRLSGMVCALAVFLILILFGRYARFIPYAVLAGILMVTSSRMVDRWSFRLIKQKSTWRDMAIMLLVAGITVLVSLMVAVGIGVLIMALLFIRDQVSRSVIKHKVLGSQMHSKRVRNTDEMEYLTKVGQRIAVYQLDGSLFFGTADGLVTEIEKDLDQRDIVILDFRLVKEIDLTGAQIIRQLYDQLEEKGKHLLLSYVTDGAEYEENQITAFLRDIKVLDLLGPEHLFPDTDRAMEWAENRLLQRDGIVGDARTRRIDIKKMKIFQYLNDEEIARVSKILVHSSHKAGEVIFREGEAGDTMYLVSRGCVNILFDLEKGRRKKRVISFGEGVFFGDMALLEEKPRSATAVVDEETELYALSRGDFLQLIETEPRIASKVQLGIARELSARIRSTSEELRALEM